MNVAAAEHTLDVTVRSHLAPLLDGAEAACFDAFLRDSPFAAYQQSRAWPLAAPRHARRDWRFFRAFDGDTLIGACVIRVTRLALGAWLATIQRGPIVHDAGNLGAVLAELRSTLRRAGCCSVQIGPRVRGRLLPDMAEAMRGAGFAPMPTREQALHQATGVIWLDKPEAEILAGFKQRARRALRSAGKTGIAIRAVECEDDLGTYQRLLDAFGASRPGYDRSGQPDAHGQAQLIAAQGGAMLLAERDGAVIGAHAFVAQADEAIWLSLATIDRDGASPGYPLLWEGMRRARATGCIGYDLAGLPETEPGDAGEAGRVQFKNAFAPHRRLMPPMQVAALAPVRHTMLLGARRAYRGLKRWRGAADG